jgi:cytochrome P450
MATTYTTARAPGALPLLGHAVPLLRDPLRFLASLPGYGDLVQVRIGPLRATVVCDPELTRQVLLDDRTFDKGGVIFDQARDIFGNNLGTCPHGEHRRQRRLAQPAFHHARFPVYARVMTERIAAVTGAWEEGQVIDVLSEMLRITATTLVETMLGSEIPPATLSRVIEDFTAVIELSETRMLMPALVRRLPLPGNQRFTRSLASIRQVIAELIARHRADGTDRGDLLSMLLAARDDQDTPGREAAFSDTEISDQVLTFFAAGTATTAATMAWALHLVAQHPGLRERLHAEVDTVLNGVPATLEKLPELTLTSQIITEALRLYPSPMFTRATSTDTELGGHHIPAGTTIVYSPYLIHRRPGQAEQAGTFNPDRWSGSPGGQPPRGALIPFGAGARKCIGDTFAVTEATLAVASIAARWQLNLVPGKHVRPAAGPTVTPRGLYLRATARTAATGHPGSQTA